MAELSKVPLVRRKRQRWVGSTGDPSGGEGQLGGGDRGKDTATPDIADHRQSRRGGVASMEYDFGFASSDVEDVTGPSMRGFEGLHCYFVSYILFWSCTRILICVSWYLAVTIEVDVSLTPPKEASEPRQGLGIPPDVLVKATSGDTSSFL